MKVRHIDHHPDEWLVGVAGLTPEQNGIYRTVCDLIASTGGPIPLDDERLFRIIKAKRHRINRVISELVSGHKLIVTGSQLSNNRVISELERAHKRIVTGVKNVAKRWENNQVADSKPDTTRANHQPPTTKEEEDSGAKAPAKSPQPIVVQFPDPVKRLWDRGKDLFRQAGMPEAKIGPAIGRLRKDFGDSAVTIALDAAEGEHPSDLMSFMVRCASNAKREMNGHAKLTPANQRFLDGREATLRAVLERERAAEAGDG